MLDRVPVPTDNVYKFYALFSLVALVFCVWLFFSKHAEKNAIASQNYPEIAEIKAIKEPTAAQVAKLEVLEQQIEVAKADKKIIDTLLGVLIGCSLWLMGYGFLKWHKEIQPVIDASQKAQLEILQLQVEQLKLQNEKLAASLRSEKEANPVVAAGEPGILVKILNLLIK